MPRSPLIWLFFAILAVAILTLAAPAERSLGGNVRVVYLHGAWVWVALLAFVASGAVGLTGIISRRKRINIWSRALGRTGLFFWITYLPISLWAMQTNWNGLFLAEPRWRLAVIFAIGGLALQLGLTLLENPAWASAFNLLFVLILWFALQNTEQVMHPPSPILTSNAWRIQLFFSGLLAATLLAGWQVTRLWLDHDAAWNADA